MTEVLIFAAEALVVFVCIAGLLLLVAMLVAKAQQSSDVQITPLHEKWKDLEFFFKSFTATKAEMKKEAKRLKKERKAEDKKTSTEADDLGNIYVLNFDGDIRANQVENLREEVTAILQVATPKDEIVVILESPGGLVSGYGLAAAQMLRFRSRGIKVTACVDQVAASGGYMMACTATQILSAPFAVVGSIGVVAQFPNFNKVLKKYDVDFKEYTAGEYKRTVSTMAEITPAGEAKFKQQLEETHLLFKDFVQSYRPQVDLGKIATGEYWYGKQALELNLIDAIKTSDDYLLEKFHLKHRIFEVEYEVKTPLTERLAGMIGASTRAILKAVRREVKDEVQSAQQMRPF